MADNRKEQERDELHRTIWGIANDLRGSVDGWDFKQYVLGMLSIEGALEIRMNFIFLRGKAPLPGADSPYQGEMSRRDKRGRDAVTEGD